MRTTCFEIALEDQNAFTVVFISARFPFNVKHTFFDAPRSRFPRFPRREGLQVELYVGPMLELVLRGILEGLGALLGGFWEGFGRLRRAQDGPSWRQDASR